MGDDLLSLNYTRKRVDLSLRRGGEAGGIIAAMDVLIRLYASYRETAGLDRVTLPLNDGAVVADAVEALLAAAPALPRDFKPHLIAVNEEFGNLAYPLSLTATTWRSTRR